MLKVGSVQHLWTKETSSGRGCAPETTQKGRSRKVAGLRKLPRGCTRWKNLERVFLGQGNASVKGCRTEETFSGPVARAANGPERAFPSMGTCLLERLPDSGSLLGTRLRAPEIAQKGCSRDKETPPCQVSKLRKPPRDEFARAGHGLERVFLGRGNASAKGCPTQETSSGRGCARGKRPGKGVPGTSKSLRVRFPESGNLLGTRMRAPEKARKWRSQDGETRP